MPGTVSCGPGARWWLLVAATGLLLGALPGCSGSQVEPHPTSASALTSGSTSSPSPAPPTASQGRSASVAARVTPACRGGQLAISFASSGAGAGNWAAILRYKNIAAATCSLRGYPKVTAFDTAGRA